MRAHAATNRPLAAPIPPQHTQRKGDAIIRPQPGLRFSRAA